jgi:hypothetical protein
MPIPFIDMPFIVWLTPCIVDGIIVEGPMGLRPPIDGAIAPICIDVVVCGRDFCSSAELEEPRR